jgi:hypothetical protein
MDLLAKQQEHSRLTSEAFAVGQEIMQALAKPLFLLHFMKLDDFELNYIQVGEFGWTLNGLDRRDYTHDSEFFIPLDIINDLENSVKLIEERREREAREVREKALRDREARDRAEFDRLKKLFASEFKDG